MVLLFPFCNISSPADASYCKTHKIRAIRRAASRSRGSSRSSGSRGRGETPDKVGEPYPSRFFHAIPGPAFPPDAATLAQVVDTVAKILIDNQIAEFTYFGGPEAIMIREAAAARGGAVTERLLAWRPIIPPAVCRSLACLCNLHGEVSTCIFRGAGHTHAHCALVEVVCAHLVSPHISFVSHDDYAAHAAAFRAARQHTPKPVMVIHTPMDFLFAREQAWTGRLVKGQTRPYEPPRAGATWTGQLLPDDSRAGRMSASLPQTTPQAHPPAALRGTEGRTGISQAHQGGPGSQFDEVWRPATEHQPVHQQPTDTLGPVFPPPQLHLLPQLAGAEVGVRRGLSVRGDETVAELTPAGGLAPPAHQLAAAGPPHGPWLPAFQLQNPTAPSWQGSGAPSWQYPPQGPPGANAPTAVVPQARLMPHVHPPGPTGLFPPPLHPVSPPFSPPFSPPQGGVSPAPSTWAPPVLPDLFAAARPSFPQSSTAPLRLTVPVVLQAAVADSRRSQHQACAQTVSGIQHHTEGVSSQPGLVAQRQGGGTAGPGPGLEFSPTPRWPLATAFPGGSQSAEVSSAGSHRLEGGGPRRFSPMTNAQFLRVEHGLANLGAANCFLNAATQALLHIPLIRTAVVNAPHACPRDRPCVVCALRGVAVGSAAAAPGQAVDPRWLRGALAAADQIGRAHV